MSSYRDLEPSPVVAQNDYPAVVTVPDGTTYRLARVVLTHTHLYVFTEPGEPAWYGPIDPAGVQLKRAGAVSGTPSTVLTPEGSTVSWTAARGCGCSNPLKTFRPFAGPRRSGPLPTLLTGPT